MGQAALAAVLAGAVLGFLVHNWPKARVFLGDNGSYLVGGLMAMMAGWVAFRPSSESAPVWPCLVAAVLLVGVPVLDLAVAVVRRTLRGESPLRGDRSHYSDWLRRRGLPASAIALIALGLQSTLSLLAFGVVFLLGRPT